MKRNVRIFLFLDQTSFADPRYYVYQGHDLSIPQVAVIGFQFQSWQQQALVSLSLSRSMFIVLQLVSLYIPVSA
jgi:hypothetical protein